MGGSARYNERVKRDHLMKQSRIWLSLLILVIIAAAVALLVGHTKPKTPNTSSMSTSSSSPTVASDKVTISNYMFSPAIIKVKVGTTVTWTNQDAVSHTVTADNPSGDAPSSMDIAQGKSYSFTFTKAGTYTYHCFPHPYMHGTVEVN